MAGELPARAGLTGETHTKRPQSSPQTEPSEQGRREGLAQPAQCSRGHSPAVPAGPRGARPCSGAPRDAHIHPRHPAKQRSLPRPTASKPLSGRPPNACRARILTSPIFIFSYYSSTAQFLGAATCTPSRFGFCPWQRVTTCAPSWLRRSSARFEQQHCPEQELHSLFPPLRLPASVLTFLAPLLKQLNSLYSFFFFFLCGSRCNLP